MALICFAFSGHHAGQAQKALTEFVEFDLAISEGLKLVNLDETLVVVTADHSHV
jgi:alkaline phosphatase